MATFAGTTQKCKACEKTMYLVDQLTADSKVYHKACFRCHHCKGTLKVITIKMSLLNIGTHGSFLVHYPECLFFFFLFLQVAVDGESYHKSCFRCTHGGCVISPSNYVAHEHRLYCKHHHTQLFKQKGNFSQLGNGKNEQVTVVAVAVAENAAAE
ncbi:pollen-specific protein SF3 [Quercus suber]|uniref:pollen-specific protein SF3 n=1 Tax=Quercus suber TaxID=58331 RepID=UPI0032DFB06A